MNGCDSNKQMDNDIPSDPTAGRVPGLVTCPSPTPQFKVVFDHGRSPYELERADAAARSVLKAIEAMQEYPKPTRNPIFEVSMHHAATAELQKLREYLAALRDFIIDAQVANLRGHARLQAIQGGRAPAPDKLTKEPR